MNAETAAPPPPTTTATTRISSQLLPLSQRRPTKPILEHLETVEPPTRRIRLSAAVLQEKALTEIQIDQFASRLTIGSEFDIEWAWHVGEQPADSVGSENFTTADVATVVARGNLPNSFVVRYGKVEGDVRFPPEFAHVLITSLTMRSFTHSIGLPRITQSSRDITRRPTRIIFADGGARMAAGTKGGAPSASAIWLSTHRRT